ncbi:hypothetical protein V8F33_013784 [Rhypophila sp. PSN 637]
MALAFAVKVLFSASISVGYTQCVWRKLKTRPYSLNAVDALFTLLDNPLGFFSIEILWQATGPAIIAALSWSLAFIPILTPAGISIRAPSHAQYIKSLPVPTLNFTKDVEETQYRSAVPITPVQLAQVSEVGAAWGDYQTSTTAAIGHIYNTLYSKSIANIQSPCGANCSFEQRFHGPAYKCSEIDFANIKTENGEGAQNPFCALPSASDFGPCGAIFVNSQLGKTVDGKTWYLNLTNFTALQEPGNMETKNYAAYSIHETLYSLLSGEIAPNGRDVPSDSTHLAMSGLVEEMPVGIRTRRTYRSTPFVVRLGHNAPATTRKTLNSGPC